MNDDPRSAGTETPTTTRLGRLYEEHAPQVLVFTTLLTGDPDRAGRLTDEAFVRLSARFVDLRHPDSFPFDLRRAVVRLAGSRRERTTGSRSDVLARAAAILRLYEGLSDEQVGAVVELPPRRVSTLVERGRAWLEISRSSGDGVRERTVLGVRPSARLERRWKAARIRMVLAALLFVSGSGVGGWKSFQAATASGLRSDGASSSAGQPVIAARIALTGSGLDGLFPFNGPGDIAGADGVVWIGGHFGVVGIEQATNRIVQVVSRTEGVGFGGGLAAGEDAVFVAEGNDALIEPPGALARIDPGTGSITGRFALAGMTFPHGVAVGEGAVWLDALNIGVYRIDPNTMETVATIPLPNPQAVVVGYGSVWAITGDGSIAKIDPATNTVVDTIPLNATDLEVGEGAVWALGPGVSDGPEPVKGIPPTSGPPSLVSLDPVSGEVRWMKPIPANAIAVGAGAVWAIEYDGSVGAVGTLRMIDPATGSLLSELDLEASAVDLCVLGESVWVLDAKGPSLIRVDV